MNERSKCAKTHHFKFVKTSWEKQTQSLSFFLRRFPTNPDVHCLFIIIQMKPEPDHAFMNVQTEANEIINLA